MALAYDLLNPSVQAERARPGELRGLVKLKNPKIREKLGLARPPPPHPALYPFFFFFEKCTAKKNRNKNTTLLKKKVGA